MKCPQCERECATAEGVTRHRQVVHHNLGPRKPKVKGGTNAKKRSAIVLRPLLEEVS